MNPRTICIAFATALAALGPAAAEPGPTLTRILIGYGAGGGADVITRAYAQSMARTLKRDVIVENKPGAGGTLAGIIAKRGPADGSVLLFGNVATHVLSAYTFRAKPYDEAKDFVPVGEMAQFDLALAVAAATPARTLADYIQWAKGDPHRTSFGTAAAGSLPHFFGLLLGKATGLEMVHVPYKSGPAINAELMGGQLPAAISAESDYVQLSRAGKLRVLATSGTRRSPFLPDVPTFRELGYPDLTGTSWFALFAPAGTPPEELQRLRSAMQQATRDPQVRKVVDGLGVEMPEGDAASFARFLADERSRWGPVVQASGFVAE